MISEESAALLNQGIDLSCEVEATRSGYRRLAYIWQLPDRFQTSEVTQFTVGCFELPIAVVEAEARGELVDQVDTHVDARHLIASGSEEALMLLKQLLGDRRVIQALQDDKTFRPSFIL
ncbi:MAG: hypothetical protein AAFQ65_01500 [Myxococcota bacterium]